MRRFLLLAVAAVSADTKVHVIKSKEDLDEFDAAARAAGEWVLLDFYVLLPRGKCVESVIFGSVELS